MEDLKQILQNNGLNQKEATIYLASLRLGPSPVSEIARQSRLNRVTTYEILKKLHKKGFASVTEKRGGVNYFSVLSPDRLFQRLKGNLEEFQASLKKFLSIMDQAGKKPKVLFFEGQAGVRQVYEDFLAYPNSEILCITRPQALYQGIGMAYHKNVLKRRKKLNIRVKALAPDTSDGVAVIEESKHFLRDLKLFPHRKYTIPNEIIIYQNKVALTAFTDQVAVIIENKEIADSMRNLWQMAWDRFK